MLEKSLFHQGDDGYYVDLVEFKCEFSYSIFYDAKGCFIHLTLKSDNSIMFSNSINKTFMTDSKVKVSINGTFYDGAEYILKGYIIETTGSTVLAFVDNHYEINMTPTPSGIRTS